MEPYCSRNLKESIANNNDMSINKQTDGHNYPKK